MQYFKKVMKQILFQVLEFQIVQGATFWDTQLAPSKFNPRGASGQFLISNTVFQQVNIKQILTDGHKDIANTRQNKNIKDPQKKYRLGTVSKIFYWRA